MDIDIRGPIVAKFPADCLSCGARIHEGDKVYWVKGVGVWHAEDERPRSLEVYVREAQARR